MTQPDETKVTSRKSLEEAGLMFRATAEASSLLTSPTTKLFAVCQHVGIRSAFRFI